MQKFDALLDAGLLLFGFRTNAQAEELIELQGGIVTEHVMRWDAAPDARMVILATHRRTTASRADRIYQLAAGRLVAANGSALDDAPIREVSNA